MDWSLQLPIIISITIAAVISPGSDFAIITRNTLRSGLSHGAITALGIACGVTIHIAYSVFGLGFISANAPWFLDAMRYVGAAYLIWLGISAFRAQPIQISSQASKAEENTPSLWSGFYNGFFCNMFNPKTALFFIALFTQVIAPETSELNRLEIGFFIAIVHLIWFLCVAVLFSWFRLGTYIQVASYWIERLVGSVLFSLGAKLLFFT